MAPRPRHQDVGNSARATRTNNSKRVTAEKPLANPILRDISDGMRFLVCFFLLGCVGAVRAATPAEAAIEKQVADLVAGPQVTVVHFWAPWCPNCQAEMRPEGWAKLIASNPSVKFVFLNIWTKGLDPAPKLAAAGLGAQPNLLLLTHPNPARKKDERLQTFLGQPLTWIPTTWVYKEGKLYYALNYGEVHFDVLQRCLDDSLEKWEH